MLHFLQKKKESGFTMVEIIVAISVLSFGIISVYGAFSMIINATYNISGRFTAAYLAQEGLEVVRNLRDNNFLNESQDPNVTWSTGLLGSPCDSGCILDYKTENFTQLMPYNGQFLKINDAGFYSNDSSSTTTIFQRKITTKQVTGLSEAMNVQVDIYWNYNGKLYTYTANENLYNWY